MAERSEAAAYLLASALHLKEAAVRAGRDDVAAKADEVVALLTGPGNPIDGTDERRERNAVGNAVLKVLDGLGF